MSRHALALLQALAALLVMLGSLAIASSARAQVVQGSNGFYDVAVDSNGDYTSRTGQFHPVPRVNVFYNGATLAPGTTWNTVRSYRSNTEWLLENTPLFGGPRASTGFTCGSVNNGSTRTVTSILDGGGVQTGVHVEWAISNGTDDLVITQEVNAEGTTYESSVVRVTVCVANRGAVEANVGIRFQWDWQIAAQDGAYIGIRPPSPPVEPFLDLEQDFPNPTWDFYDVSDQIRPSVTPPSYRVGGTVNRPTLSQGPTAPELLQYTTWPGIVNSCFDYATSGQVAGSTDSAIGYYWGATPATAIRIASGESYCATQYVFVFSDVPPPLCQLTPSLVAGTSCETPVTLDASSSSATDCVAPLEYRFLDPSGRVAEDWSTDPFSSADSDGAWSVEVRCQADPSCTATDGADVRIDRFPSVDASGGETSPCDLGVKVSWTVGFNGPTRTGVVNVYRSEVDCADALTRAPVAPGVIDTGYADATTVAGATYWYVVEAEDGAAASPCIPAGFTAGGAATRVCVGPITDSVGTQTPAGMCWPLRVSHVVDDVTLDWGAARALLRGEHFHVMKVVLDPSLPLTMVNGEADLSTRYAENDRSAWLQFFDVRIASECELVSADDEPPYFGGPIATCP